MGRDEKDPLSPMVQGMTAMHEMFLSLTEAGFTERQALTIITDIVAKSTRG